MSVVEQEFRNFIELAVQGKLSEQHPIGRNIVADQWRLFEYVRADHTKDDRRNDGDLRVIHAY